MSSFISIVQFQLLKYRRYFNPANLLSYVSRMLAVARVKMSSKIIEANFMGCNILVKTYEDVGLNILVGGFEFDDINFLVSNICNNDVVFDIGANIGVYSIIVGKKRPEAKIFAFEPIPINAQLFKTSLHLNGITNVQVIQKCVSNSSGEVSFSVSTDSAYSSMIDTRRKTELESIKCQSVRVDEFCAAVGINKIDVVKIDVEGAEELVILGAGKLFSDPKLSPRLILVELFDQNLVQFTTSVQKIVDLMLGYGYSPFVLIDGQKKVMEKKYHNKNYNVFFEKIYNQ